MTPEQAAALAARILAAIDEAHPLKTHARLADRERVASDLRAIQRAEERMADHRERRCCYDAPPDQGCSDWDAWTEDRDDAWARLRLTAALYGVTERPPVTGDVVDDGSQFGSVLL